MLEFNIRNQEISRIDSFSPAEKSVGYLLAKFNFKTDDWNGASKIAVFKNLKTKEEYDRKLEEDACIVPSEALSEKEQFEVSVYGLKDGRKITSNVATCNLNRTLSRGSMTEDDSLNAAEKLLLEAQNKLDKSGHAPNKFLGTDEKGNVVTKEQEEFSLKVASEGKLGGVKPLNKTDDMTLEVGVDKDGRLFAKGKDIKVDSELSEESENPVQNQVLTKEVIALKERNAKLKETIEKLQIKVTTEKASFHNIKDSANMKVVDFGMEGKTEQRTTSGKNLFDVDDFKNTEPLSIGVMKCYKLNTLSGQTYTFNRNNSDGYDVEGLNNVRIIDGDSNTLGIFIDKWTRNNNNPTITFTATDEVYLAFTNLKSIYLSYFDTYFINPQLELGSVATDYEPFTNGASPNPDFEQKIENAGVYNEETGRYEHKGCAVNKNILDTTTLQDGFIKSDGTVDVVTWYKCTDYIYVKGVNSIYTHTIGSTATGRYICFYDDEHNFVSGKIQDIYENCEVPSNAVYVRFNVAPSFIESAVACINGTIEDSTPHASQPFTLTSPVPLTKWDKLVKRDGVWGWSIWQLPYVFDGSESSWYSSASRMGFSVDCFPKNYPLDFYKYNTGYCNQFTYYNGSFGVSDSTPNNVFWCGTNNTILNVCKTNFYDDTLSDYGLANWKAHLAEHPLELITYAYEEQSFHPLPDEEQELLNNLETYYGVTNLYNDQGCPTWLEYIVDNQLYIDNKVQQINNALLSLGANV